MRKIRYIEWAIKVIAPICDTHQALFNEFKNCIEEAESELKYKVKSKF